MRTKTLLLTAAAMAAGLASSVAQSNVYSINVVGYVNQALPAGALTCIANPLNDGSNALNSALGSLPNKSTAQIWNGAGFTPSTLSGGVWGPNFSIPPGVGLFVNAKSAYTNTYIGSVACNLGGFTTNALPGGVLILVGSQIPFSGDLNTTNFNLTALPNKSTAQFWTGSGYTPSTLSGGVWGPVLPISVAQGFFLNAKSATNWVEYFPIN